MKLNFRDLKQQKFVIEAEPSETIGELKAKVQSEKGWEPSTQKLIYSGKILQDDKTIESYSIEEKGFIVCMIQKVHNLLARCAVRRLLTSHVRRSRLQLHHHLPLHLRHQLLPL